MHMHSWEGHGKSECLGQNDEGGRKERLIKNSIACTHIFFCSSSSSGANVPPFKAGVIQIASLVRA